ncbi:MAG: hypothetical protein LBE62_16385 [Azonexus sp.]|jgi:hypothetical protein|nr:hypothetical protein [Azonexus sp.]
MSVRVKRHWFRDERERPPTAIATAIAAAIWKASAHGLQSVRRAEFAVDAGGPFIDVLAEFLALLVTAADRIAYRHDDGEWRQAFTTALVIRLAEIYQENLDHLIGPAADGGRQRRFIDLINRRMGEYAEFEYDESGPDFGFRRYFGACIEAVLPDPDDRRWALDQMMSIEAPQAVAVVERGMRGLLGIDPKPRRHAAAGGE